MSQESRLEGFARRRGHLRGSCPPSLEADCKGCTIAMPPCGVLHAEGRQREIACLGQRGTSATSRQRVDRWLRAGAVGKGPKEVEKPRRAPAQANGPGVGNGDGRCPRGPSMYRLTPSVPIRRSSRRSRLRTWAAPRTGRRRWHETLCILAVTCAISPISLSPPVNALTRSSHAVSPEGRPGSPASTQRFSPWTKARRRPGSLRVGMAVEVQTGDAGYTNRPSIHAQARWRVRLENHTGRQATGRAVDRMLLPCGPTNSAPNAERHFTLASRPQCPDEQNESASPPSRGGDDPLYAGAAG